MHVEFLSHYSGILGREMYMNRYGYSGMPVLVFPTSGGSQDEFADNGMIDAAKDFINSGRVQFFTLESINDESWLADKPMHDRALAQNQYDKYLIEEAIPFIKHKTVWFDPMMLMGCSMGAYHTVNFYLRHPDVFTKALALSGVYDVRYFGGDYGSDFVVYENSPADFLWNLNDPWYLDKYNEGSIIVCTGHGAWEDDGLPSFYKLKAAFEEKQIPAWFDEWGNDVAHDWPSWRAQLPYFLAHLFG